MRKVVILVIFIVILAGLGVYWYSMKPSPVWTPEKDIKACNADVQVYVPFLKALEKPNANDCAKLSDEVFNSYCFAKFGVNVCNGTDDELACNAILQQNLAGCGDDWTCHAVLGNEAVCTNDICRGLARRDLSMITNSKFCEQAVAEYSLISECRRNATSMEQADACLNQSSLTV